MLRVRVTAACASMIAAVAVAYFEGMPSLHPSRDWEVTRSGQSCSISNVTSSLRIMSCLQRATMSHTTMSHTDEQAQSAKLLNPVRATPTSFGSVVPLSSDEFLKCMLSGSGRIRSHG